MVRDFQDPVDFLTISILDPEISHIKTHCYYLSDEINMALAFLYRWRAFGRHLVSLVNFTLLCSIPNSRHKMKLNYSYLLDNIRDIKSLCQGYKEMYYRHYILTTLKQHPLCISSFIWALVQTLHLDDHCRSNRRKLA